MIDTASEVFPRPDEESALRSHAHDPVPSLRGRVQGWLPEALEQLILSCLAKRPQERPDDCRAMAQLLRAIPIPAEHAWTEAMAQAWWQRNRPTSTIASEGEATSVERVIVPSEPPPMPSFDTSKKLPSTGPEAPTVEQRHSERIVRR